MNLPHVLCNKSWSIKVFIDMDAHGSTAYLILNCMIMISITSYPVCFYE